MAKPDNKKKQDDKKAGINFSKAFSASVEEVIGRAGVRGDVILVRCKILEGRDQGKVIKRNVRGPVRKSDILMLRETEFEARPLKRKGRSKK